MVMIRERAAMNAGDGDEATLTLHVPLRQPIDRLVHVADKLLHLADHLVLFRTHVTGRQ